MMSEWPRITIVTPSFNQGAYIGETIESVLRQAYPDLEHIVIDGGSTDETLGVLDRYPHLHVISEPDRGQADAINKGFARATGGIWGYLNSDDTLLPDALRRVAREIDPARKRHIVMGRCRFVDAQGRYIGIEHPSHFENARRVLQIWKGHLIPQPAVFWTPEVWRRCGGMDLDLKFHLDYDLFCRFALRYDFHFIDQVLATYRLHPASKTGQWSEAERLEDSIRLSRRYWGSPRKPMYWRVRWSLARHRFNRVGRARRWFAQGGEAYRRKQWLRALLYGGAAAMLAPDVAFYVTLYPKLKGRVKELIEHIALRRVTGEEDDPQTKVYLDRVEPWQDGWVGPRLVLARSTEGAARSLVIYGRIDLKYIRESLELQVWLDGQTIGAKRVAKSGEFKWEVALAQPLEPGEHTLEVRADKWFVPHRFRRSGDHRPLAWRFHEARLIGE
jgi:glycosyltransferase involved in cell wall biosynthesis